MPAPGSSFVEDTEDESDARLRWLGLRAGGEVRFESRHRLIYRADLALVRGRETLTPFDEDTDGLLVAGDSRSRRVRGQAYDLGLQWRLSGDARPTFSLGLAGGSSGFRQTGLQENKSRVAGVKRLRYYGELLDPELSNLRIGSIGAGLRFRGDNSVELLLHAIGSGSHRRGWPDRGCRKTRPARAATSVARSTC